MIDFWQRFFGNSYTGGGSQFTSGGGTFPSTGGAGSDFSAGIQPPFGEMPGIRGDAGRLPWNMPGEETVDPHMQWRLPAANVDPRMVIQEGGSNDLLNVPQGGRIYDPVEMQGMMDYLNRTGPSNITNPAPEEDIFPGTAYGQPPDVPQYNPGDLEMFFGTPEFVTPELTNPNRVPTPGMETIGYNPPMFPPGMPPGQDLNFGAAPDYPGSESPTFINPVPSEGMTPTYADYPAGTDATYYPEITLPPYDPGSVNVNMTDTGSMTGPQWPFYIDQFPTPPDDTAAGAPPANQPQGPAGPTISPYQTPDTGANLLPGYNPYSYGPPSTPHGPLAPADTGAMGPNGLPIIDPMTGMPVAGSILSESDAAKRYNMEQFNDPRYRPSSILHPGQTAMHLASDAAGNIIDGTGKIIAAAGDAARALWNNIQNDPRNTGSDYLASIGYQPGQGYKSQFPASVTGPSAGAYDPLLGGVAGQGASFFHGSQYSPGIMDPATGQPVMDVPPSAMNPGGYNYPRHGAISVTGAGYGLGGMGTTANITALSRDIFARKRLREMAEAYYAAKSRGQTAYVQPSPTKALVGGPPGSVFSPSFLKQYPMYKTGPYSGGTPIVNAGAFGGQQTPTGAGSRASIHFNPRSVP